MHLLGFLKTQITSVCWLCTEMCVEKSYGAEEFNDLDDTGSQLLNDMKAGSLIYRYDFYSAYERSGVQFPDKTLF